MITYSIEELISSSKLIKNFWWYISKIKTHEIEKIWVLKNNKLDAIIISVEEYEILTELLEHIDISNSIKDRLNKSDFVDANIILEKFSLSV